MMKQIWKYQLTGAVTTIDMPHFSQFLKVEIQDGIICAWFMVLPGTKQHSIRTFKVYGTEHDIPMKERYLGTFQRPPHVWHLFEVFT
jgi:hypothetical protein